MAECVLSPPSPLLFVMSRCSSLSCFPSPRWKKGGPHRLKFANSTYQHILINENSYCNFLAILIEQLLKFLAASWVGTFTVHTYLDCFLQESNAFAA